MPDFAVKMQSVSKFFGKVAANQNVNLHILDQTIHAIVGENGAGKSTIMKILYGMYLPDQGEIEIFGKSAKIQNSLDAIQNGIGMVHQHFMLIPNLSVAENVILGYESPASLGRMNILEASEKIKKIASDYNLPISPSELIENLSVGQQQRVEILKALYRNAQILILDEPTAVLTPLEVRTFFQTLKNLKKLGKTIILITHKLEEVMEVADHVTVMRGGEKIGDLAIEEATTEKMARMMVGRDVLLHVNNQEHPIGKEVLRVENLNLHGEGSHQLKQIDFKIHQGEILGIAGVSGNGQTELEMILAGLLSFQSGKVIFQGQEYNSISPESNRKNRIVHIPSDREKYGYVHGFSNAENAILGYHHQQAFCKMGLLQKEKIQDYTESLIQKYKVNPPDKDLQTSNLSGGNKQKLVIAREFETSPVFMIVAEPTRGVDIGAIEFIHNKILELRDQGVAILLISAELQEIRSLSDRALVLFEGRIAGEFFPKDYDEGKVGMMMTGKKEEEFA